MLAEKMHPPSGVLNHTRRHAVGFALASVVAATVAACGGATTEQLIAPSGSRCRIDVAAAPVVPAAESSVSLTLSAARDCTWTAATEASWLVVTPASGQGDGALQLTVAENAQPRARSGALAVNETRITISQDAAPCRFELASPSTRLDAVGGRASVNVSAISGCQWEVTNGADWIQLVTRSGDGSGTVTMDVSPNSGAERSATLTIAGVPFVVSQDRGSNRPSPGSPPSPTDPDASCTFTIDPASNSVPASGGSDSVRVTTGSACEWTASSNARWISVERSSGVGSDAVPYRVSQNTSTVSERSGSISVAGRTHSVRQPACGLSIDGGVPGFLPSGGDSSFGVRTDSGCTWEASSTVDWIIVTGTSGSGSGSVTYRVAPNPIERDRSGTIVVSGRSKTVVQQALGQGG